MSEVQEPSYLSKLEEQLNNVTELRKKVLSELGDGVLQLEALDTYIRDRKAQAHNLITNHQALEAEIRSIKSKVISNQELEEKMGELLKKTDKKLEVVKNDSPTATPVL